MASGGRKRPGPSISELKHCLSVGSLWSLGGGIVPDHWYYWEESYPIGVIGRSFAPLLVAVEGIVTQVPDKSKGPQFADH